MKINHETNLKISIVTDLKSVSLEQEIINEACVKAKEIISFIDQIEKTQEVKTLFYENSFTVCFNESIICLNILNPLVSWKDIIMYKDMYNYYERF